MNSKISFFSIIIILVFLLFINLGKFLDVTEEPIKSDIIVCLGGGYGGRISKAIDLYSNSYSNSNKMILTGYNKNWKEIEDRRIKVLKKYNISMNNIIFEKEIKSTRNEIVFIKKYMIQHGYKKAIIVTDRPHSKRVSALLNILTIGNDKHLSFSIIGSEVKWWDSAKYYENKTSFLYAIHEFTKLSYTYIAYGFLEKIGILEYIKKPIAPIFNFIRNNIDKYIYKNTKKTLKNED